MKDFKIQQAILKYINKNGTVEYCEAKNQQLEFIDQNGETQIRQSNCGYWLVFNENAYRLEEHTILIDLDKLRLSKMTAKIIGIEDCFNNNNKLISLEEPQICIKSQDVTYAMFLYGQEKHFVEEKDLKVLENNYKDYEYKLCKINKEVYILAISIKREMVAIFKGKKIDDIELIGGKYED